MKSLLIFFLVFNAGAFSPNAPFQIFKTSLTVTVRDELGNTVEGASVKLFLKEEDYTKEVNPLAEATTDKKGVAKFNKLSQKLISSLRAKAIKTMPVVEKKQANSKKANSIKSRSSFSNTNGSRAARRDVAILQD